MVKPADSEHPSHPFGIFPELNTQCREINRHCGGKNSTIGFVFWIVFLTSCLAIFGLQIYNIANNYNKYEVVQTRISKSVPEIGYPELKICPMNALNITKMINVGLDADTILYLLSTFDKSHITVNQSTLNQTVKKYKSWLNRTEGVENLEQALLYFALDPKQQIYCEVLGEFVSCFPTDAPLKQFVAREGVCFMLELFARKGSASYAPANQTSPGYVGASGVIISNTKDGPFIPNLINNFAIYLGNSKPVEGYRGKMPLDGIFLSHKSTSLVSISQKRISRLDEPYGSCYSEVEIGSESNYTILENEEYSLEMCYRDCQAAYVMKSCGCIPPGHFSGAYHNQTVCDEGAQYICVKRKIRNAKCQYCEPLCRYVTWTYTYNNIQIEKDVAVAYFYHPDISYTMLVETPAISVVQILSAVGGQMSLWLGFKLATIVQMVYYACVWGVGLLRGQNKIDPVDDNDEENNDIVVPN